MKTEIEVKFININIEEIRAKLRVLGAECEQPMRLMRRQVFYLVDRSKDAYLRVRDEGNKTTITYKQFDSISLHGAKEIEVTVSDFKDAIAIIKQSGLEAKSYQETNRETWLLDSTEVVIDVWPWLNPFIEIEGNSEEMVRQTAEKLGFNWKNAVFGAATQAYRQQYTDLPEDFIMDDVPEIRFNADLPERLRGKNGA